MRREIAAVVVFLETLFRREGKLEAHELKLFFERLVVALREKFEGHWYPENPLKGHAYRCVRINRFQRQDPELLRACRESGVQYGDLGLPHELTLWLDPGEVCCRYEELSHFFSVATFPRCAEQGLNPNAPEWYPGLILPDDSFKAGRRAGRTSQKLWFPPDHRAP